MSAIDVFVDEYGDKSIHTDKDGVTSFFIITAVLIPDGTANVRDAAEEIRRSHFQTGEMKSSGVADNDTRRLEILSDLTALQIKTYSLAVDKRELYKTGGLANRDSLFKFLHKKLYRKIYSAHEHVNLIADRHGSEEFMEGFKKYFDAEVRPDLFLERPFEFEDSKKEVLLQVADFISGSLARRLDPKKITPGASEIAKVLASLSAGVEVWPPQRLPFYTPEAQVGDSGPHDTLIHAFCWRQAQNFLKDCERDAEFDDSLRAQCAILRLFLFKQFTDDLAFVRTKEILSYLRQYEGIALNKHQLRTVIAKLRDANVIIASGQHGYKLPISAADIAHFVAHAKMIVPPMLTRLERARNDVSLVTMGKLDILSDEHFADLRALLDRT